MLRIALFLITNLAVMLILSIIMSLLGLDKIQGYSGLLVMCAVMGFGGSLISLFMSKWLAKRGTGVQIITQPKNAQEQWLLDTVAELAQKAGIDMPEVGIFPSQTSNAFATGWNKNAALVAISQGLLDRFTKDEAKAVMAHEIGHVANGDMVTLSLIQGVVNTFVMFFARIIAQALTRDSRGGGMAYYAIVFALQMVLGILASMIVAWFSRWREFRADAAGASLADRQGMINALARLRSEQNASMPPAMPDNMAAFGISSGGIMHKLGRLMASHPPLDIRINALKNANH